jgi:hypothetical protein
MTFGSQQSESKQTDRGWSFDRERSAQEDDAHNRWGPGPAWRERSRRAGYVIAIIVNALLLYIAHHLLAWGVPFVTPGFGDVLWAVDLSMTTTIVTNAVHLAYDAPWFRDLTQLGLSGLAFVVAALLYAVFPFDFGAATWSDLGHLALLLVMLALVVAMIVQTVVLLIGLIRRGFAR